MARLFPDGTVDPGFDAKLNGSVTAFARQQDGKVVLAGNFSKVADKPWQGVGRINPDGTPDSGFDSSGATGVNTVALQRDGRILVGGSFTTLGGQSRNNLGRLLPSGAVDTAFNPMIAGQVYCIAMDRDDRIVLGGSFTGVKGQSVNRLARLMSDGTLDTSFATSADSTVFSLAPQADGKVVVGGEFRSLGSLSRSYLGRLLPDGRADPLFNPAVSSYVRSISVLRDGSVAVGGSFTSIGGTTRKYFARLAPNCPAISEISWSGSSVSWIQGGSSPEVSQATFEVFESGQGWRALGIGKPTATGWELNGVTIPSGSTVRARGPVSGGRYCGSGSEVSASAGPPVITSSSFNRTLPTASLSVLCPLSVVTAGSPPFAYQWYVDGKPVAGGTNQWLLKPAYEVKTKKYEVVVSSPLGVVRSAPAVCNLEGPDRQRYSADYPVEAIALQPDGKIIISGALRTSAGITTQYVARLHANGTRDTSFNPAVNAGVLAIVVQEDGKILMEGNSDKLLVRLNPNGTLDSSFQPNVTPDYSGGYLGAITALAIQRNGSILVGGTISFKDAPLQIGVGRLLPNGSLDSSFVPPAYSRGSVVKTISVLPDQSVLIGGCFGLSMAVWVAEHLSPNGERLAKSAYSRLVNPRVFSAAVQSDGKLLLGGIAISDSPGRQNLIRFNTDMSIDTNFAPYVDGPVLALAAQAGGETLVGGAFKSIGGVACTNLALIRDDGSIDQTFSHSFTGTSPIVWAIAPQLDGGVLIGGEFEGMDDRIQKNLIRLYGPTPTTSKIWSDGYSIIWTPESEASLFYDVVFSYSLDSSNWTPLGVAVRQDRSWQVPATVPYGATIRVQAFGSSSGVSSWVTDSRFGAPEFLKQPEAQTNAAGGFILLSATVSGLEDVGYQWYKGNLPLADDLFTAGANSSSLALGNLALSQGGTYFLVASNILGCTTSSVVELTIRTRPSEILAKDSDFGFQEGKFGFGVKATPGTTCVLLVSSNLVDWVPVQTNMVHQADGVIRLSDPQSSQTARRFYRVAYEQ
jgi:uncharacterized delta-60 repeat protein